MKIVGISGKRESGKSTLANFLRNYGYAKVSLAALLKEKCKQDFGLTEEQVNGHFKESPTQFRRTNQFHLFKDESDLMWITGFFEGEGSAGCYKVSNKSYYCLRASISQNHIRPIEFLRNYFGFGSISKHAYTDIKRKGLYHYSWEVTTNDARIFLNRILPYMKHPGKIDQVITALKLDEQKVLPNSTKASSSFLTPREIMIQTGLYYRSIDPLFWCKALKKQIEEESLAFCVEKFVIDDIRFLNEIEYFKKLEAKFVRLERNQEDIGKEALNDLSETELDNYKDWDGLLLSPFNRNLEDLHNFADYLSIHL